MQIGEWGCHEDQQLPYGLTSFIRQRRFFVEAHDVQWLGNGQLFMFVNDMHHPHVEGVAIWTVRDRSCS